MKKVLLFSALFLITLTSFCQTKADTSKPSAKGEIKKDTTAPRPPLYYSIVMTGPELDQLFNFIRQADLWSDKGKQIFLDDLAKKVHPLPQADTVRKK